MFFVLMYHTYIEIYIYICVCVGFQLALSPSKTTNSTASVRRVPGWVPGCPVGPPGARPETAADSELRGATAGGSSVPLTHFNQPGP